MRSIMMKAAILAQQWRINPTKLKGEVERIFRLLPLEGTNRNFLEMIVVYPLTVKDEFGFSWPKNLVVDNIIYLPTKEDLLLASISKLMIS